MRTLWIVAAIGACAMISGCDQTPEQTAQVAAPPPPACACRPTPPQETASAAQTATQTPVAHHHRHHWEMADSSWSGHQRWRGDYSRTDFTQSIQAPYDYVSQSSVTYVESGDYPMRSRGYGRGYRDTIAATMTGERLDPWHGYGVYCPQR
jgi:hypothetical protein